MEYLLLLLILVGVYGNESNGGKSLRMVHFLYRHGARSPIHYFPKDKYQEKDWPDGAGRLTQKGMNEEYELGRFLKVRYQNFISRLYLHKEIHVRSSDSERCLQSAESQLAGLYPPQGYQVWNTRIPWQPIPVHTVPTDEDVLLRPHHVYCQKLFDIWNAKGKSPEYLKRASKHENLFTKLSNYTGTSVSLDNIGDITDPLKCEKAEGLQIPAWAGALWDEMMNLSAWRFKYFYRGSDELARLAGGSLLGDINVNMKKMSEEKSGLHKLNIYSGHDYSILGLAGALDVDVEVPGFATSLIIELHHLDEYSVKMWYRKSDGELKPLKLKQCPYNCPLSNFLKLTENRIPVDRSKECQVDTNIARDDWKLLFIPIVLGVILLCFMVCALYLLTAKSRRVKRGGRHALIKEDKQKLIQPLNI